MLRYVSKFAMDILPSVVATIIGAYIVNHYIVTKPGADAPVAGVVSTTEPKKAEIKSDSKPLEATAGVANVPAPGVRAKGISEKAIIERSAVEKPAEKPQDKSPREKTLAKAATAPVQPTAVVVAAPTTTAPVEAAVAPEEHRDANDLARAAIERLRGTNDVAPRAQEAARVPDAPRAVPDASRIPVAPAPQVASAPPVRPLPPPIMVSAPAAESVDTTGSVPAKQPYDPARPTPPAEIPASRPLDLHADASEPGARQHTNVAEDMLLAAKSMFHAVLPIGRPNNPDR